MSPTAPQGDGPRRIVHVSDCFPPRVGGIETQVHDLAAAQARAGHDVHVLTASADPSRPGGGRRGVATSPEGVTVHRFASVLTAGAPFHPLERIILPPVLRGLATARTAGPAVVHVHAGVVSPFAYAGARAARSLGLPLAVTWHCMLDGVAPFYRAGARLLGWDRAPFAPSAVSRAAAARVAHVLRREEVAVVPNGLDVASWRPAPGDPPPLPPEGPLRVVATQRLEPRKRTLPLLHVLAEVHQLLGVDEAGRPQVALELIGSGSQEEVVRREIRQLGLTEVVTMAGRVDRRELRKRYAGAHVFLAPARLEAFGIAALEARAAGLAVVAREDTGVEQFVTDGVDGILTAGRSWGLDDQSADTALAGALLRLASEPGLLTGMLQHNRSTPPAADWTDVVPATEDLYREALAARA